MTKEWNEAWDKVMGGLKEASSELLAISEELLTPKPVIRPSANEEQVRLIREAIAIRERRIGGRKMTSEERNMFGIKWIEANASTFRKHWEEEHNK